MGLRCLIGHDFGEPQIERDRDEQGDEVVVSIREFKECARCGHRRTVSENKEITSLAPSEPDSDPDPDPNDSVSTASTGPVEDSFDDVSAEEDDGVILEDEPDEEPSRGHGEWPAADIEEDTVGGPAVTSNGEVDASGEPSGGSGSEDPSTGSASLKASDEVVAHAGPEPTGSDDTHASTADETGSSADQLDEDDAGERAWPEVDEAADEGYEAEASDGETPPDAFVDDYSTRTEETADSGDVLETAPTVDGSGIESRSPGPTPGHQQRETPGVETEFVCPSCDHTLASAGSSLRPGDICPECGKGYLTEREMDGSRNR